MTHGPKLTPAVIVIRMKRLPHRHRIAHLRTLIWQQTAHSVRREQLAARWRDAMAAHSEPRDRRIQISLFEGAIQHGTDQTQQAA